MTAIIASDRWCRVAEDIAVIKAALTSLRAVGRLRSDRHRRKACIKALGVIDRYDDELVRRAFREFMARPDDWHVVLGCPAHASTEHVRANYRKARSTFHPDKGGDADTFASIQRAWSVFCAERGISE